LPAVPRRREGGRQEHNAGEKLFVDFSGRTIPIYDEIDAISGRRETGRVLSPQERTSRDAPWPLRPDAMSADGVGYERVARRDEGNKRAVVDVGTRRAVPSSAGVA
jgi:hypothetical protein